MSLTSESKNEVTKIISQLSDLSAQLYLDQGKLKCDTPPGALSPELRSDIEQHREALVDWLSQRHRLSTEPKLMRLARTHDQYNALSAQQLPLWLHWRLRPEDPSYNIAACVRLHGHVDHAALSKAIAQIFEEQEALRTRFDFDGKTPYQQVISGIGIGSLDVAADFSHLPVEQAHSAALEQAELEVKRVFDLAQAPLARFSLIKVQPQEFLLVSVVHHIVCDGWSQGVLVKRILELYQSYLPGRSGSLPPRQHDTIQYVDYAAWQATWLQSDQAQHESTFWATQLQNVEEGVQLPVDSLPRTPETSTGKSTRFSLSASKVSRLKDLANSRGTSLFSVLLSTFYLTVARISGQDDLVVGTPSAGRFDARLENTIGCFSNFLPLRLRLVPDWTGHDLVDQVKELTLLAFENQRVPFDRIIRSLQSDHGDPTDKIRVMFALQSMPLHLDLLESLNAELVPIDTDTAKFDLSLICREDDNGLQAVMQYRSDMFTTDSVTRWGQYFENLIGQFINQPQDPLTSFSVFTPDQLQQILVEWNKTSIHPLPSRGIQQLFEEQVARTPKAAALLLEDRQPIDYQGLNRLANRLAHHLKSLDINKGRIVGLLLNRSVQSVVAMLAVCKSGAAFMALDLAYPQERLSYMIAQAKPSLILSMKEYSNQISSSAPIIDLDELDQSFLDQPETNPACTRSVGDPLYVIFTSGSTGEPKGVITDELQLINRFAWMWREYPLKNGEVGILKTSLNFVDSQWETFGYLLAGTPVVVAPKETLSNLHRLVDLLARFSVTRIWLVPSLMRTLLDTFPDISQRCPHLYFWSPGGEPLTADLVQKFDTSVPHGVLLNLYGISETWDISYWEYRSGQSSDAIKPLIGRPIDRVRIYLLDSAQQPVPVGSIGEIYVAGAGLSRGYIGENAAANSEKFPVFQIDGTLQRLFRTGDLGRYLPDGQVEYIGRADRQVKIRGYRVELGEIEACLLMHPNVREAIVLHQRHGTSNEQLIAYVIPHAIDLNHQDTIQLQFDYQGWMRTRLPQFMQPSAYVVLESFPKTPSGKLDRRALANQHLDLQTIRPYVKPRTEMERIVATLFQEILGLEQVSVTDGFIELGGSSLALMQLQARLMSTFKNEVAIKEILERSTPAAIAELFSTVEVSASLETARDIPEAPAQPYYALSHGQTQLWLHQQAFPASSAFNVTGVLNVAQHLEVHMQSIETVVAHLIQRHECLRTVFRQIDGQPVQIVLPSQIAQIDSVEVNDDAQLESLIKEFVQQRFDLEQGPLLRVLSVTSTNPELRKLVWVVHHLVCDGVSLGMLSQQALDLFKNFEVASRKESPQCRYIDYVHWQNSVHDTNAARDFWLHELSPPPSRLALPYDYSLQHANKLETAAYGLEAPPELSKSLKATCIAQGTTPFGVLLAAFAVLLHRISNQDEFVIGIPVSGRNRASIRDVIGFFVNTTLMKVRIDDATTYQNLLQQILPKLMGLLRYQDYPFDRFAQDLGVRADPIHFPLTPVLFNMLTLNECSEKFAKPVVGHRVIRTEAKIDWDWFVFKRGDHLHFECHYKRALFQPQTIEYLVNQYVRLAIELLSAPDQPLVSLMPLKPIKPEFPIAPLKESHNQTNWHDQSIADVFWAVANRRAEAPAIRDMDSRWSYAELLNQSLAFCQQLSEVNTQHGSRIGLLLGHQAPAIAAILGTLLHASTYVPLDTSLPVARLMDICAEAQISVLVPGREYVDLANQLRNALISRSEQNISLIPWSAPTTSAGASNSISTLPGAPSKPGSSAYILFTSGTTGKPKGILQNHANVLYHIQSYAENLALAPHDKVAMLATYAFDAAVMDIYGALLIGAELIMIDPRTSSPINIRQALVDCAVTVLHCTPTVLRYLCETSESTKHLGLATIRLVVLGGEMCTQRDIEAVRLLCAPGVVLVNGLGPSEATVALQRFIDPFQDSVASPVPVGWPVGNTAVQLLQGEETIQVCFKPGEIVIHSNHVALGYLGDETANQSQFGISADGVRFYRTGDYGSYGVNGEIRPLGRRDSQIKINGIRIELKEIETTICRHPLVRDCICALRPSETGQTPILEAVCVIDPMTTEHLDVSALRSFVNQYLPHAMCPARWGVIAEMWKTPTGKTDYIRTFAEATFFTHNAAQTKGQRPVTEVEAALCRFIQEVLGVAVVGTTDHLFELGANSLQTMRILGRIRATYEIEIPIREVFQNPTVKYLAALVERLLLEKSVAMPSSDNVNRETIEF